MGLELDTTQHALLRLLLHNKEGLTVDVLMGALGVSRNAVRQHLSVLERDGAVARGPTRPTGGRPEQVYRITSAGQERFPRRYSWFAEMLIGALRDGLGDKGAGDSLAQMGRTVGREMAAQFVRSETSAVRIEAIAQKMAELGYEARASADGNQIDAQNCVFHRLAMKYPDVCRFDLVLLATASGRKVEHRACMAKGDAACTFHFTKKREA